MSSKYAPLESHLRDSRRAHVPMTFREIEHVIGAGLPPAAFRHRALWSNNPGNWVMTKAWLAAGYETEKVDMRNAKLVFRRVSTAAPAPDAEPTALERSGSLEDVFDAMKGTVTIAPGTNLTDPIDAGWDVARRETPPQGGADSDRLVGPQAERRRRLAGHVRVIGC